MADCTCPLAMKYHAISCPERPNEIQQAWAERIERENADLRHAVRWLVTDERAHVHDVAGNLAMVPDDIRAVIDSALGETSE